MKRCLLACILIVCASGYPFSGKCQTDTLTVMSYNLLYFPDGPSGLSCNQHINDRADTLRKILQYVRPDVFLVCELQTEAAADSILSRALNVNGTGAYKRAGFIRDQSGYYNDINNMMFYDSTAVRLYGQDEIRTDLRDVNEYVVYGNDPQLGNHQDTTFLHFYMAHLKAGSETADEEQRALECDSIRAHVDEASRMRNNILGGDFNFSGSAEAGYQVLTSGTYPFHDPLNREGNWYNNSDYEAIHTQSTRSNTDMDCGARGGMDDRYDMLLTSGNMLSDTNRVQYLEGSYKAFGNDGNHFNEAIRSGTNTSVPDSIANALYYTSDHLPVLMDLSMDYPGGPVYVDKMSMKGKWINKKVLLQWTANASEEKKWLIQRRLAENTFKIIDTILYEGSGKYKYTDQPERGYTYYYQLKKPGKARSGAVSHQVKVTAGNMVTRVTLYPNPLSGETLYIQYHLSDKQWIQWTVRNSLGQQIRQKTINHHPAGRFTRTIRLNRPGIYYLTLSTKQKRFTRTVIKQ